MSREHTVAGKQRALYQTMGWMFHYDNASVYIAEISQRTFELGINIRPVRLNC